MKSFAIALLLLVPIGIPVADAFADASDPVVATVNDLPIRLSYVYQHIEALPLGDQIDVRDQLDRFTESVIQEEVLFQFGLLRVLDEEPAIREEIKTILLDRLIEKYVKSRIDITDKIVEAYYRDHRSEIRSEHWRVYHIPLKTGAQCEALMPRLTSVASFAALARQYSTDPALAEAGGDLGYVMRHHNVLGLGEDLFELPLHRAHRVDNEDGCHLIWISEHVNPPLPSLDEVKDRIRQVLERQQEVELLQALLERTAKEITVHRHYPLSKVAKDTGRFRSDDSGSESSK
ncbi:MAG: peptidylprolyl isomerase [Acidiferrobacterales bacterium]